MSKLSNRDCYKVSLTDSDEMSVVVLKQRLATYTRWIVEYNDTALIPESMELLDEIADKLDNYGLFC